MGNQASIIQQIQGQVQNRQTSSCNQNASGVKYIQLGYGPDFINLSQLVGIDKAGNNVTRGRPSTGPVGWGGEPRNAVDGGEQPRGHPNEYHSAGGGQVFEVTLDGPTDMASVTVYNRADCCSGRMAGHVVKFLDSNKTIVWTSPPLLDRPSQTVSVCDAPITRPPGYLKEQKRIELNMAKTDVVKKQQEYDDLTPAEALKRKTDQGNAEATKYIEGVTVRSQYENDIYEKLFSEIDILANSPSFKLAQKYRTDLAQKYDSAVAENAKFKDAYVTNRRRFLDANPHESVSGIGPFQTLDDRILLLFWTCYLLFLIPTTYYIVSGLGSKIGTPLMQNGATAGVILSACLVAHLSIKNFG